MRSALDRFRPLSIIAFAALIFAFGASAQTKKTDQKKNPSQAETQTADQQDVPLKFDTDLVTVPVIASDRADVYVPDLNK
ncbi:MAG TPA: hypothetical protein VKE91_14035, partial [Blastocatellia bacterium]|nr:hypothetical protein [Blastocatellia bacterium]